LETNSRESRFQEKLQTLPNLSAALGMDWIRNHARLEPFEEDHEIARWLTSGSERADEMLRGVDQALAILKGKPRFREWQQRLANDIENVWGTLVEVHLASWLVTTGYDFQVESAGADFLVILPEGGELRLEIYAPQPGRMDDHLFERLSRLAREFGYQGRVIYTGDAPWSLTRRSVARIIETETNRFLESPPSVMDLEASHPNYGVNITWTRAATPHLVGRYGSVMTSPEMGAGELIKAVNHKRAQLDRHVGDIQPLGLVVVTNAMAHEPIQSFYDYALMGHYNFPWELNDGLDGQSRKVAPAHLRYLIPLVITLSRIGPPQTWLVLTNPDNQDPDPRGFDVFLDRVFK
jgi:hypothetical protein